jgi:nicotinate-nucleotide--dimethylbenzimidazole phosphoribosyltransferase
VTARAVLEHVVAAISPASAAQAAGARLRLGEAPEPGSLAELAVRLAAARHAPAPRTGHKALVIVLGEHGASLVGALGDAHPAVAAARAIAAGEAAVAQAARAVAARLLVVDAALPAGTALPAEVVRLSPGEGARDIRHEPAMTPVDTLLALQRGIALTTALADDGLDVLALGHVAPGAEVASAAVIARLTGADPDLVAAPADRADVAAALAAHPPGLDRDPLAVLTHLGGPDLALLTGAILAAASIAVPVVLEDHGTGAAALVATRLAPAVAGYLIAGHGGASRSHRRALAALGLTPLFALGLGAGEGTGAALALGLLDGAARLLER